MSASTVTVLEATDCRLVSPEYCALNALVMPLTTVWKVTVELVTVTGANEVMPFEKVTDPVGPTPRSWS